MARKVVTFRNPRLDPKNPRKTVVVNDRRTPCKDCEDDDS
jgi:hypothetical protein